MAAERPPQGGAWTPSPAPTPKAPAAPTGGGSQGGQPLSAAGGTPTSKYQWAVALIQALGGTPTPGIVNLVVAWIDKEGTKAAWNPLAITGPGGTFNSVGVENFTSFTQGVQATAQFLQNGRYPNIVNAIRTGDPSLALAHLNEFDTWGGSAGYGSSLVGIYQRVSGDKTAGAGMLVAGAGGGGPSGTGSVVASYILQNDPSLDWALGVPELQAILAGADVSSSQGVSNLTAALMGSDYYRSHSSAARDWTNLQSTDPSSAARQIQATEAHLREVAAQLGLNLSDSALSGLALGELSMGWTPGGAEEHQALLAATAFSQGGTSQGAIGDGAVQAKQLFAEYGIRLDDATAQRYGLQINVATSPTGALENLRPTAIAQAKGLFPGLAPLLDQGVTVENVFSQYRGVASTLLGIDPSSIDLTDPKWSRFLEGDNKTGPMSQQQAAATIQKDPLYHWDTSANGRASAVNLASTIGRDWGVMG